MPRIDASSASQKAAVDQPVFVTQTVATPEPAKPVAKAAIAKDAIKKLAVALRGASVDAPRGSSVDPTPIASLSIPIDDARRLCAAGLIAFAKGDIAAARALLRRAAEAGDPRALVALGDTYDPATLSRLGALGLKGDEKLARTYYSRAVAAGVGGARERMASLAIVQ